MARLSTLWLQLAAALSVALIVAACSSSAEDSGTGAVGAPAAAADTSDGEQAAAE